MVGPHKVFFYFGWFLKIVKQKFAPDFRESWP